MMAILDEPEWIFKTFIRKIINLEGQVEDLSGEARTDSQRMSLEVGLLESTILTVFFSQELGQITYWLDYLMPQSSDGRYEDFKQSYC